MNKRSMLAVPVVLFSLLGLTIGTATASASNWQENLGTAQQGDVNVNRAGGEISIKDGGFRTAGQQDAFGSALFAAHQLTTPTDRITVTAQERQPSGSTVEIDVRGTHDGQWTQWVSPDNTGTVQLSSRVDSVQAKVTLHGTGAELTGLALVPAAANAVTANAAQPAAAESYKVYATDEGLVGQETSNGHVIQPNDHFVALPSTSVLSPQGSTAYSVQVCGPVRCETAPVWDVGPWNIHDDYWDAHRAEYTDLPQGEPEAQAAYQNGYNGGHDDQGGSVGNPAGIDLADGTFANIGLTDNGYVTVTYLWTTAPSASSDDGTNSSTVIAPNGHMYKFARGTDNTLRMWSSDFTTGWVDKGVSLGGSISGSPSAVIAPNGHMYIFAEGTDHTLRMWSSNFTSGWVDNDAVVAGGAVDGGTPNAVIAPNKHMYVFARGTDNNLRMWSSDLTTGWVDKGAVVAGGAVDGSAPNAVIAPNGHMYVFAQGTDNTLRMWSSDFTSGWVDQGAVVAGGAVDGSAPDAVIAPNGHMYVFARGTDSNLRMWSSNFTSGWVDQGAVVAGGTVDGSAPNAVIAPNGHMYVFARGTDSNLRMWSSDFTTGWVDKGAVVAGGTVDGGAPDSVIAPNKHMYVFAHGTDNTLRMWSSDFTTGWVDKGSVVVGGAVDAS